MSRPLKPFWEKTRNGIRININESARFFFILSGLLVNHKKIVFDYLVNEMLKINKISGLIG
jgi:hypothetical protein